MKTLLSMRQYAKKRGCSPEAVSKAVRQGRISTELDKDGKRKINPAVADREWAQNSEGVRANYGIPSSEAQAPKQSKPSEQETDNKLGVAKSAAVLKAYQARLAKLEFEEKSGQLLSADQVKKDAFKVGRAIRDAMLGIPDRLSAELAGETDQFKIRQRLEIEIKQALENLSIDLESEGA